MAWVMSREKTAAASPYLQARNENQQSANESNRKGDEGRSANVHGVVGLGENVVLVLELGYDNDGTEDLLLDNLHLGLDVGENRGFNEVTVTSSSSAIEQGKGEMKNEPLGSVSLSSSVDGSSLGLTGLDVSHDSVVLELRVLRSLEGVGGEGVSDLEGSDLGGELLHEFVVDSLCRSVEVSSALGRGGMISETNLERKFGNQRNNID